MREFLNLFLFSLSVFASTYIFLKIIDVVKNRNLLIYKKQKNSTSDTAVFQNKNAKIENAKLDLIQNIKKYENEFDLHERVNILKEIVGLTQKLMFLETEKIEIIRTKGCCQSKTTCCKTKQ